MNLGTLLTPVLALPMVFIGGSLSAQEAAPAAALAQTPAPIERVSPRLARLTFLQGSVQVQHADNTGEDTPVLNMPLPEGTRLLTGDYGQAEIEFEDGSVVRLTPRSSISFDNLTLDSASVAHTRMTLLGGLAYFELRKAPAIAYNVEAGGVQATPFENVTLRINLDEPPATFAVLAGTATLLHLVPDAEASKVPGTGTGFKTSLHAGETLRPDAGDDTRYFLTASIAPESWDQWNQDRDLSAAAEAAARTSARDGIAGAQGYGWSDLDANGTWYHVPNVGEVWQPAEAGPQATIEADAGAPASSDPTAFDPYSNGAWVWSGSGYVFASGYQWGWTPYRCGSWAFYPGFGWAWLPDPACGQWGFAGADFNDVVIYASSGAPTHIPIPRPNPGPGPHPILPVRNPTGIHHPNPHPVIAAPVKIAGVVAEPLKPVGATAVRSENTANLALALDFPIDTKTHQPVLGLQPGVERPATAATDLVPRSPRNYNSSRTPTSSATQQAHSSSAMPAHPAPSAAPAASHPAPPPPPPASHPAPAAPAESKPKS
jgi:hypothetical protein